MILHRISPNQSLHVKVDLTVVDSAHMICIFTVNRIPDMSLIKKNSLYGHTAEAKIVIKRYKFVSTFSK